MFPTPSTCMHNDGWESVPNSVHLMEVNVKWL